MHDLLNINRTSIGVYICWIKKEEIYDKYAVGDQTLFMWRVYRDTWYECVNLSIRMESGFGWKLPMWERRKLDVWARIECGILNMFAFIFPLFHHHLHTISICYRLGVIYHFFCENFACILFPPKRIRLRIRHTTICLIATFIFYSHGSI